jgi:hypothetical protein
MAMWGVKMISNYPPLALELPPQTSDEHAALEDAEAIRAWVAENYGLEQLCIMDQYARAFAALGVTDSEKVAQLKGGIDLALAGFMLRGFQTGGAPTPKDIEAGCRCYSRRGEV